MSFESLVQLTMLEHHLKDGRRPDRSTPPVKVMERSLQVKQDRASINYNTYAGLDVVFDLFTGQEYTITCVCMCVCVPTFGVLRTRMNIQAEVTVNTHPVNKSNTTSSLVSVL